jgi:hypothetical protein
VRAVCAEQRAMGVERSTSRCSSRLQHAVAIGSESPARTWDARVVMHVASRRAGCFRVGDGRARCSVEHCARCLRQ